MKKILIFCTIMALSLGLLAEEGETLAIGKPAPEFELKGIDGKIYSLESFREAKVLMVVFSANHCPTAQTYEERMKQLSSKYTSEQMKLVAISSNHPGAVCLEELGYSDLGDTFDEMKIRAADQSFNFPYLYDGEKQEVAIAYGAKATPHVFIFDEERKLRYSGRIDDMEDPYQKPTQRDALNAIEALLGGNAVPVETTKAFGCSMKWLSKMEWRKKLDEQWGNKPVTLLDIDKTGIDELLLNQEKKLRLINVWATWCGPCVIEFPEFVEMQRMYGQRNFEVISVSIDKDSQKERALAFLEEKHAAFQNYLFVSDDKNTLIDLVDTDWQGNLPYTMLIAPDGKVVFRHDGIIDPHEVKKAIADQLGRYFADD